MRRAVALLLLAVVASAGCLGGNEAPDPRPTAIGQTPVPPPTPSPALEGNGTGPEAPEPTVPAGEMLLSGCHAVDAFRDYPALLAPGERPEGWGPPSPDNIASVHILAYGCDRVGVARYERGPVYLLLDFHSSAAIPPECAADTAEFTGLYVLRHLLVDDAEVGTYLQSEFGVPVLLAAFSSGERDAQAGAFHDLGWSIGGDAPSVVTVFEPAVNYGSSAREDRLFWQIGGGLGVLDLGTSEGVAPITQLPANGTVQPPMLLASDTGGAFVGGGALVDGVSAHARFSRYDDLQCEEPTA